MQSVKYPWVGPLDICCPDGKWAINLDIIGVGGGTIVVRGGWNSHEGKVWTPLTLSSTGRKGASSHWLMFPKTISHVEKVTLEYPQTGSSYHMRPLGGVLLGGHPTSGRYRNFSTHGPPQCREVFAEGESSCISSVICLPLTATGVESCASMFIAIS